MADVGTEHINREREGCQSTCGPLANPLAKSRCTFAPLSPNPCAFQLLSASSVRLGQRLNWNFCIKTDVCPVKSEQLLGFGDTQKSSGLRLQRRQRKVMFFTLKPQAYSLGGKHCELLGAFVNALQEARGPALPVVPSPGRTATSMPRRSRTAALSKAAADQGHFAPPPTLTGAHA
ncbi:Epidermal Growth Factor Receptor Kinase Substrate 8 [Manis pentadactyla]|nr:Epidermal Growth Factor Receptor Kinase Substrate 8 [Manis pentadactyla]